MPKNCERLKLRVFAFDRDKTIHRGPFAEGFTEGNNPSTVV